MRRREIDWLRNICILMLFVYHTAVLFTHFGDFYVKSQVGNLFSTLFILATFSWYMPLMFFLAGATTYFALKKRNGWSYIKERIRRLFIPLVFGMIVLVPPQTYLARLWRGEHDINYIDHLLSFFTTFTDFLGFDGNFTPAHLWFIAFLFGISIVGIAVIKVLKTKKCNKIMDNITPKLFSRKGVVYILISMVLIDLIPSLGGKGFQTNLLIFILGYITYSDDKYIEKVSKNRNKFLLGGAISIALGAAYFFIVRDMLINEFLIKLVDTTLKSSLIVNMCGSIVGYGIKYLNKEHKVLNYLNKASFPVYIMHQTILIVVAFYIIPLSLPTWIAILIIIGTTFVLTFAAYEIVKRIKIFDFLLGMK